MLLYIYSLMQKTVLTKFYIKILFLYGFITICIFILDFSLFLSTGVTNHSEKIVKFSQHIDIKFDKIRKTYH